MKAEEKAGAPETAKEQSTTYNTLLDQALQKTAPVPTSTVVEPQKDISAMVQKAKAPVAKTDSKAMTAPKTMDDFTSLFSKYRGAIERLLAKPEMAERAITMMAQVFARNPKLQECTVPSIVGAIIQSSQLDLSPDPLFGEIYFVPYSVKVGDSWVKQCQLQIGYKGYLRKLYETNLVKEIYAHAIYKNERYEVAYGLERSLEHVPNIHNVYTEKDLIAVYAVIKYRDGGQDFGIMNAAEIERIRLKNPQNKPENKTGAWASDYITMAKAKVLKSLLKMSRYSAYDGKIQKLAQIDESMSVVKDDGDMETTFDTFEVSDVE